MKLPPEIADKFSPQLSTDIIKLKEAMTAKLVSEKLDGIRALTLDFRVVSRSYKNIPNKHVQAVLAEVQGLDGELIVGHPTAEDVYHVTESAVMSHDGAPDFRFYAFDDLTRLDLVFEDRLKALQDRSLPGFITVLPQIEVANRESLDRVYEAMLEEGFEGAIARNAKSMYKFGRCTAKSQDSLKYKPFSDDEAIIIAVLEAEQNNNVAFKDELGRTARSSHQANKVGKGMAGMFLVRDIKTDVIFKVAAGKMKHPERAEVWENRAEYVNRILKYRHFTVGVKDKPRHGRWIGWRSADDMGGA